MTFWRDLAIGQKANIIVNLCEDVGGNSYWGSECDQYWPTDEPVEFTEGNRKVQIICTNKNQLAPTLMAYEIRIAMTSTRSGSMIEERDMTVLHFSGWPDLDIPSTQEQIAGFGELINQLVGLYTASKGAKKAIVHCRGGHGRTGTFVTIVSRMLQIYHGTESTISLAETLLALRNQRAYLCETDEQFTFAMNLTRSEEARNLIKTIKRANK